MGCARLSARLRPRAHGFAHVLTRLCARRRSYEVGKCVSGTEITLFHGGFNKTRLQSTTWLQSSIKPNFKLPPGFNLQCNPASKKSLWLQFNSIPQDKKN